MATQPSSPQQILEHQLDWNDRLQDWLDGDIDAADRAAVESHLGGCDICQQQMTALEKIDEALFSAAPAPELSAAFDDKLFAQIDAIDETKRAAARQRVEEELQENLRALSRSWRRALAFVIPGVVGGIVLAFALAGYFDASGLAGKIAAEGASIGGNASTIQTALIGMLGAGIGGLLAGWLAKVAD